MLKRIYLVIPMMIVGCTLYQSEDRKYLDSVGLGAFSATSFVESCKSYEIAGTVVKPVGEQMSILIRAVSRNSSTVGCQTVPMDNNLMMQHMPELEAALDHSIDAHRASITQ